MTGKERVKAVLERKLPDRIPWGEYAVDSDTVEKILGHETYLRAKAKCQIAFWEGRRDEVVQSWKEDSVALYTKLDCFDLINLGSMFSSTVPPKGYKPKPPRRIDDKTWIDDEDKVYKYSDVTADITMVEDPQLWTREFKPEDYRIGPVAPPDPSVFEVVDHVIEKLGAERFIIGPAGAEASLILLGGMERGYTEFLTNPETVRAAYRKAIHEANQNDFHYVRSGSDAIMWIQDFAYNAGPFLSPKLFAEFCLPAIKERAAHLRGHFDRYLFKHACGNNWQLMDMFVEAGYDCLQSLQPSAGMDLKKLKAQYGDKMVLWGGLPVEHLMSGTREQVVEDVAATVAAGAPGGGYIFGSSHSIAVGTKYENFMAMLDEFEKVRYCY